MRQRLCGPV